MKAFLARLAAAVKGFRTYLAFGAVFVLAVLDQVGTIDFAAVLRFLGVPEPKLPGAIAIVSLLALVLRTWTTTPPMKSTPPAAPIIIPVPPPVPAPPAVPVLPSPGEPQ